MCVCEPLEDRCIRLLILPLSLRKESDTVIVLHLGCDQTYLLENITLLVCGKPEVVLIKCVDQRSLDGLML